MICKIRLATRKIELAWIREEEISLVEVQAATLMGLRLRTMTIDLILMVAIFQENHREMMIRLHADPK